MSLSAVSTKELSAKLKSARFLLATDAGVDRVAMNDVIHAIHAELNVRNSELIDCPTCRKRGYIIIRKSGRVPVQMVCRKCGGDGRLVRNGKEAA